jgi:leader peptidase (prepilin peptidase) / N-methyltransferase
LEILFSSLVIVALISFCWGSFLGSFSYRIVFDMPIFTKRSYCPFCKNTIFWYDNVPLLSWILLRGRCRKCVHPISAVYPFIELVTAISIVGLWLKMFSFDTYIYTLKPYWAFFLPIFYESSTLFSYASFFSYAFFFSSLIAATASDLMTLMIPQIFSVWIIPVGVICSFLQLTQINYIESMIGSIFGYAILWIVAFIFKKYMHKDGLGIGDMELLSMIGSFVGPIGVWIALTIGSISGLVIGGLYLILSRKAKTTQIPFGPFLALGGILYVLFKHQLYGFFVF